MKEPSSSTVKREFRKRHRRRYPHSRQNANPSTNSGCTSSESSSNTDSSSRTTASVREWDKGKRDSVEDFSQTPWLGCLTSRAYNGIEHRLHYEILAYTSYMTPTSRELKFREAAMTCLRRVVHGRFANAKVDVFGSSATGLSLPDSDIDVAITLPYNADKKEALFKLSQSVKRSSFAFTNVFVNHRASVPIITLNTREDYGSLKMDIGINNPLGVQGVDFTKAHLATMPALRPLVLIMKGFLRQRGLNDASKGGLGSFAVICLCIAFLQLNPGKRPPEFLTDPRGTESLGALLTDLMFYYGLEFPYETGCISLTQAGPSEILPKSDPGSKSLSICTPLDPARNVAKSVVPAKLEALKQAFQEGYATILHLRVGEEDMLGQLVRVSSKMVRGRMR